MEDASARRTSRLSSAPDEPGEGLLDLVAVDVTASCKQRQRADSQKTSHDLHDHKLELGKPGDAN